MHQDEHVCPRCGLILPTAAAYLRHWEQGCKHKESTYPNGCPTSYPNGCPILADGQEDRE